MTLPTSQPDHGRGDAADKPRARTWLRVAGMAVIALVAGAASLAWIGPARPDEKQPAPESFDPDRVVLNNLAALNVDDDEQIVVEGEDAMARNAALPMMQGKPQSAHAFRLASDDSPTGKTALKCLTQAIYYEAGFEPLQGRRAVAQVVLNRMRHPAYPHSVCGVVYQGSHRRTGCQFSFTCDGSLLRAPAPGAWRDAEKIARDALSGSVEESVGTSTHYHADYVLPKWAFTLGKLQKIGRHIFYRFNGRAGGVGAFTARYAGNEFIPSLDLAVLRARLAEGGVATEETYVPGLTVTPHVTDRHATNDVGGRLDTRKEWRLSIPDPVGASANLREVIAQTERAVPATGRVAIAEPAKPVEAP